MPSLQAQLLAALAQLLDLLGDALELAQVHALHQLEALPVPLELDVVERRERVAMLADVHLHRAPVTALRRHQPATVSERYRTRGTAQLAARAQVLFDGLRDLLGLGMG